MKIFWLFLYVNLILVTLFILLPLTRGLVNEGGDEGFYIAVGIWVNLLVIVGLAGKKLYEEFRF